MDQAAYRASSLEQTRIADLMGLAPPSGTIALDMGAADGYLSKRLVERFSRVVALDLNRPDVQHPNIETIAANGKALPFADAHFDLVLCSEVLEHIPPSDLAQVARELARVCRSDLLIGVPYRQELRLGRMSCHRCGGVSPRYGHVNSFDEARLRSLFPDVEVVSQHYVGSIREGSSALATKLLDFAHNPYGTYDQDEPCVHCGAKLMPPGRRTIAQRVATRLGHLMNGVSSAIAPTRPQWIHILFRKRPARDAQTSTRN